jgi:ribosomal protein S12
MVSVRVYAYGEPKSRGVVMVKVLPRGEGPTSAVRRTCRILDGGLINLDAGVAAMKIKTVIQ